MTEKKKEIWGKKSILDQKLKSHEANDQNTQINHKHNCQKASHHRKIQHSTRIQQSKAFSRRRKKLSTYKEKNNLEKWEQTCTKLVDMIRLCSRAILERLLLSHFFHPIPILVWWSKAWETPTHIESTQIKPNPPTPQAQLYIQGLYHYSLLHLQQLPFFSFPRKPIWQKKTPILPLYDTKAEIFSHNPQSSDPKMNWRAKIRSSPFLHTNKADQQIQETDGSRQGKKERQTKLKVKLFRKLHIRVLYIFFLTKNEYEEKKGITIYNLLIGESVLGE